MKAVQMLSCTTVMLCIVFPCYSQSTSLIVNETATANEISSDQVSINKNATDDSPVLVLQVKGSDSECPGITFDNRKGSSGTLNFQVADATNPDVVVVSDGTNKYAVVAYYSPRRSSYYAEFFEWNKTDLVSTGYPVLLLNCSEYASIRVRQNFSGSFSFEFEKSNGEKDTDIHIPGYIDSITGLPAINKTPKVNYFINQNFE